MRFWQATLLAVSTAWSHVNAAEDNFGDKVIDLTTQKWTLTSPNHPEINIPATIPSQAHVDLYKAGRITDPYASSFHNSSMPTADTNNSLEFPD